MNYGKYKDFCKTNNWKDIFCCGGCRKCKGFYEYGDCATPCNKISAIWRENNASGKERVIADFIFLLAMVITLIMFLHPNISSAFKNFPCCQDVQNASCGEFVIIRFSLVFVAYCVTSAIIALTMNEIIQYTLQKLSLILLPVKISIIVSSCYGATFIPPLEFDKAWLYVLSVGTVMFIVAQIYTVIRFAYVIIISLHQLAERGSKSAYRLQIMLFITGMIISVLGVAMIIYYYPLCTRNIIFLVTNALVPLIACFWSISDCVKARNGYSGFLQGSILIIFVIFYTWSAFTNVTDKDCNPYYNNQLILLTPSHILEVVFALFIYLINSNFSYIIYIDELDSLVARKPEEQSGRQKSIFEGLGTAKIKQYSPEFCKVLRAPLICFVVLALLGWTTPHDDIEFTRASAMWFQLAACWISIVLYIIMLYTPSVYGLKKRSSSDES